MCNQCSSVQVVPGSHHMGSCFDHLSMSSALRNWTVTESFSRELSESEPLRARRRANNEQTCRTFHRQVQVRLNSVDEKRISHVQCRRCEHPWSHNRSTTDFPCKYLIDKYNCCVYQKYKRSQHWTSELELTHQSSTDQSTLTIIPFL